MSITIKDITTETYTLLVGDDGLLLRFNFATAVTVTCPDTLVQGFQCQYTQNGEGQVTFVKGGTSAFVDVRIPTTRAKGSYGAVTLDDDAVYKFNGEFSVSKNLHLSNTSALVAPVNTDDSALGYTVGSVWVMDTGLIYDCVDDTVLAAVWKLRVFSGEVILAPFIVEPATPTSGALLYVDVDDNDLKAKMSDGTIVVLAATV